MTPELSDVRHLFTAIDHVGIAVPDLDEAMAFYRDAYGMQVLHEEVNEEQGVREAMVGVGDRASNPGARASSCWRRSPPSRRSPSSSTATARGSSSSPSASTTSSTSPTCCAGAACACCTTPRGAAPRTAASTSSTPRTPAACWSSWSSPPPVSTDACSRSDVRHTSDHSRLLAGILTAIRATDASPDASPGDTRAEHPRRHPVRQRHLGGLRQPRAPGVLPRRLREEGGGGHVRGPHRQGEGPAQVPPRRGRAAARARARRGVRGRDGERHQLQHRVDLDLRAGLHLRLPRALRPQQRADQAPRPAVPRGRLRPVRRRAQDRAGRHQVEARRPRRGALPLRRARGPRRPQRHDARHRAADLGLRDQLRRPRRRRDGQGQPADAQARAPDLGGGRLSRPRQLHGLPPARQQERRRHEAGRQRPHLGRLRRPRRLRDAVRPQRRRHAGVRGLQRGEGRRSPAAWARS